MHSPFFTDHLNNRRKQGSRQRAVRVHRLGHRQKGISLLISLLLLVLVTLAAAAMMRSLDSNTMAVGNMSFRQAAEAPTGQAIEEAMKDIGNGLAAELHGRVDGKNYFASIQEGEDGDGIPKVLQGREIVETLPGYPSGFSKLSDGAGNRVRYVIERMCREEGEWTKEKCLKGALPIDLSKVGTTSNIKHKTDIVEPPATALFRITVRVDGPAGTRVFTQVMATSGA